MCPHINCSSGQRVEGKITLSIDLKFS